jgi:hypothetical protein
VSACVYQHYLLVLMYIGYPRAEAMNENGGLLASAIPQPDPIFTMTTGRRDRDRKVVGNYLIEVLRKSEPFVVCSCLLKFVSESLVQGASGHFPWGKWCEFAFTHRLILAGWPRNIAPPGPGFSYKNSITSEGWKALTARIPGIWRNNPLRDESLPELDIMPWTDSELDIFSYATLPN